MTLQVGQLPLHANALPGAAPAAGSSAFQLLKRVDFRAEGNGQRFARAGFARPEAGHTWSLSPQAELMLPGVDGAGSAFVVLRIDDVFCHPRHAGLRVSVSVADGLVFEQILHGPALIGFDLPDVSLCRAAVPLTFGFPDTVVPRDVGLGDPRPLAARLAGAWLVAGPGRRPGLPSIAEETELRLCLRGHCRPKPVERIWWRTAAAAWAPSLANERREKVVFVGSCHAGMLQRALAAHSMASRSFAFDEVPLHMQAIDSEWARLRLGTADWVFVQALARRHLADIKRMIPKTCRIQYYPDLVFRSAWPFMDSPQNGAIIESRGGTGFLHVDHALERLRALEPDRRRRIDKYVHLAHGRDDAARRAADAQDRFLVDVQLDAGSGLGDFVRSSGATQQLFHDAVHPSVLLLDAMCRSILRAMGFEPGAEFFPDKEQFSHWALPVHPAVAQNLGLVWAKPERRFQYGTLGEVTWHEWVEAYVQTYG